MYLDAFLLLFWVLPVVCCVRICDNRNRTVSKGVLLGVCFGWLAAIGLWLALRKRSPETLMLY
jgi:hypothetical protein